MTRALASILLGVIILIAPGLRAGDLPWVMVTPRNDTRDAEMQAWDELDSIGTVALMNREEAMAEGNFVWGKSSIEDVLRTRTPFAELRIDPVHPMEFTPREKEVLVEWFKRGGFLLLLEDTYPYEQEEFRKLATLPAFDFLIRELPFTDPDFTFAKAEDDHPIFNVIYTTKTADWVAVERRENPHYRGRQYLEYKGRMVAFFMGRYNLMEEGRWIPMARPFPRASGHDVRGYYLMLNLYAHAMIH